MKQFYETYRESAFLSLVAREMYSEITNNFKDNYIFESNEALIKQMFAEFENWEPTPQPDIIYKRHHRRNVDTCHGNNSRDDEDKPETDVTDDRDNEFETDDNGISIYDFDG